MNREHFEGHRSAFPLQELPCLAEGLVYQLYTIVSFSVEENTIRTAKLRKMMEVESMNRQNHGFT